MTYQLSPKISAPRQFTRMAVAGIVATTLLACGDADESPPVIAQAEASIGSPLTLRDTMLTPTFDAAGIAAPIREAALSTKLMGTVTAVRVLEGDRVSAGDIVVEIDSRDLDAKAQQVAAAIADAEAMQREAAVQESRMRALYNDSAATKAQLDASQTALSRAESGVRAAKASAVELDAMRSYSKVRAPFSGIVVRRSVDPGSFAAPGAPLVMLHDVSSLRLTASVTADAARYLKRGQALSATVDGVPVMARVEGVVPAGAGNLFTMNAIVANAGIAYRAGSAAIVRIPLDARRALMVPLSAVVREGDLTGVVVRRDGRDDRRWVRLGYTDATHVEITSGVSVGEVIVVPTHRSAQQ